MCIALTEDLCHNINNAEKKVFLQSMTIYDIAKQTGLSIASVSRYFNHPEKLSAKSTQVIQEALARSNYVPSQAARSLAQSNVKIIGILISDMQYQRFAIIASNLEKSFFAMGYNTIFCNTGDSIEKTRQYLDMLASRRIEALILIGSQMASPEVISMLKTYFSSIPIVSADMETSLPNGYSVTVDHKYGISCAIDHLVEKGHTHIGFVASTNSMNTARKISIFKNIMISRSLPLDEKNNVIDIPLSECGNSELDFGEIVRKACPECTAFIFSHEQVAVRAISSLQFHGCKVPGDYAVIGYDDTNLSFCCQPTLTTIDTQLANTAKVITNLIDDIFNEKTVGNRIIINPSLIVRAST